MSSLSHHYSWYKALISLKPLLDFLLPTSAYQQPSLPSFTTHKLGGRGDHRCLEDTKYETMLPPKGNRKWRKRLHPTTKAFKLGGFRSGLWELKLRKSGFKVLSPDKTLKKVAVPELYLANLESRVNFISLKRKCPLKIKFSCHKTICIDVFLILPVRGWICSLSKKQ